MHYFIQQNVSKETRIACCSLDHGAMAMAQSGADAKSHRKKLVLLAPIMRGDKTKGILATVQWSAAKKARSRLVRQKDVEESLPSGPYRVDLLWNPN